MVIQAFLIYSSFLTALLTQLSLSHTSKTLQLTLAINDTGCNYSGSGAATVALRINLFGLVSSATLTRKGKARQNKVG